MQDCFKNKHILSEIVVFLNSFDIIQLSNCNKTFKDLLSPSNNSIINIIFLFTIFNEFFNIEQSNYNSKNKKNLLGKNINFSEDFKLFLKQFKTNFKAYKDENVSKRVLDFFKIHMYLPDLRKECFHLEFENSSIHQLINYDINSRLIHTYNYYSKFITFDTIILNKDNKAKVKILREKLLFEGPLIKFKDLFRDFVNNNIYYDFVNKQVITYKYENMYNIYVQKSFHTFDKCESNELNEIFNLILWINHIFIWYCKFNFGFVNDLRDNIEDEELLSEYITKKNDLINCALLINSHFENINIIINFLAIFKNIYDDYHSKYREGNQLSLSACSSADSESNVQQDNNKYDAEKWNNIIISPNKFTLYNLFQKSIEHYYTKKLEPIMKNFQKVTKNYFQELFIINQQESMNLIKKESNNYDEEDDESMKNEIKSEDEDDDFSMDIDDLDAPPTKKELIEGFCNSQVDRFINGFNANAIMHSNFKIDEQYINDIESTLIILLKEQILKSINADKMPIEQCFEIVDKITKCEGNSKNLCANRESLVLIRRTKKRLMKKGYNLIFTNLIELLCKDFSERLNKDHEKLFLSAVEKLNMKDYKYDMKALSEEGEQNVEKNVEEDHKRAKAYLIKTFNLNFNESKLAEEYITCVKIPYVFLFKKLLYNYYIQLEIYKERNFKVKYYLEHNKTNNISINEKEDYEENQKDEMPWNNVNCGENKEVPIDSGFS